MLYRLFTTLGGVLLLFASPLQAQQIRGDYMETRSADVYTGQCFANGEVNLVGDEALLGWHVQQGSWNGVRLDDLTVVAAVKARATLGDPYADPYPARAVLIVDDHATPEQKTALVAFAQHAGGELLHNIEQVLSAPAEFVVSREHHGMASLRAGRFAVLQTRSLDSHDHICGNEVTFYPPLTRLIHSMPAVATTDSYRGPGLGVDWETHGRRSAFIGTFEQ